MGSAVPSFAIEREAGARDGLIVVGIDEAGRGPLAGPVVAAAVAFEGTRLPRALARDIDDSKALPPEERLRLAPLIRAHAHIGLGAADVAEIDQFNILRASLIAMRRAVERLGLRPDVALVDGTFAPDLPCRVRTVVDGDALSLSIAAASIVAKVTRDRLMTALAYAYPGYGWTHNAGYATEEHRDAIKRLGLSPQHRRTFRTVYEKLTLNI
jgi:ribonuclease HII